MECPRCGSENVTHSHRRGTEKLLRYFVPRVPYRCKECWSRFWKFHNPFQTLSSKIAACIALLCVVGIVIFLVLPKEEAPPEPRIAKVEKKKDAGPFETAQKPPEKADEGALPGKNIPEIRPAPTPSPGETAPPGTDELTKKPGTDTKVDDKGTETKPDEAETVKHIPARHKKPENKVASKTGTRRLKGVRPIDVDGDFGAVVTADGPIKSFSPHFIKDEKPKKFYIDLPGKWDKNKGMRDQAVKSDMIYNIRFGKHADFFRIVFDLKKWPVFPELKETGEGMIIVLRKSK